MAKSTYLVRENLASRLARDVMERIAREEIAAGERLPTEAEIATQYGVSRTVVREAISRLRADGVVTARPGTGTFVMPEGGGRSFRIIREGSDPNLIQVLELRIAFEVEAARLAAARRTADDLLAMSDSLQVMAGAIAGEETGVDADLCFHRHLARATGNPLFMNFFEFMDPQIRREIRLARQNTASRSHRTGAALWLKVQEEHVAMFRAIETGNSTKAAAAVRTHLRNTARRLTEGAPVGD